MLTLTTTAQLYTSDVTRALRVSAKVESGNVSVNAPHFPNKQVPFGGWKESGSGQELGKYGLQQYLQTKTVVVKYVPSLNRRPVILTVDSMKVSSGL
jgi:aldehyde dehydrogenase (NAD+)